MSSSIEPPRLRSRRIAQCRACGLDPAGCMCAVMQPIAVRTRVAVVIHRVEVWKPSNTGRLATHLLEGATLHVHGDNPASEHRHPSHEDEVPGEDGRRALILFPREGARVLDERDASVPWQLIVPDGNWRQARKITRRRSRDAEVVTLPAGGPSRYGLRRAPHDARLATIEAIARAMRILEGDRGQEVEEHLLASFAEWLARYRALRGVPPVP